MDGVCGISKLAIVEHAESGDCPAMKFPARGAGDLLGKVIHAVTGDAPCGTCIQVQKVINKVMPMIAQKELTGGHEIKS